MGSTQKWSIGPIDHNNNNIVCQKTYLQLCNLNFTYLEFKVVHDMTLCSWHEIINPVMDFEPVARKN